MKRIIALILLLTLCATLFSSCFDRKDANGAAVVGVGLLLLFFDNAAEKKIEAFDTFYDDEFMLQRKLSDMPLPNLDGSAMTEANVVHLNMTDNEFIEYCQKILAYLLAKEDAYYKGYGSPTNDHHYLPLTDEYSITPTSQNFIFSTTPELNNYGDNGIFKKTRYASPVIIMISRENSTLKKGFKKYEYNTSIEIIFNPIVGRHYDGEIQSNGNVTPEA